MENEIDPRNSMLLAQMETCGIGRDVVVGWLRGRQTPAGSGQPGDLAGCDVRDNEAVRQRGEKKMGNLMFEKLLPCPFCGGENINSGYIRDGRSISCRDCGASVHAFQPNAEEEARGKWNRRAVSVVEEGPEQGGTRVTEGWQLVPMKLTTPMILAYNEEFEKLRIDAWANARLVWSAMLAAAPTAHRAPSGMGVKERERWQENMQAHGAAMRMVCDAIEELFGPVASLESDDASLLRGPEPHYRAEGVVEALQRMRQALIPPAGSDAGEAG